MDWRIKEPLGGPAGSDEGMFPLAVCQEGCFSKRLQFPPIPPPLPQGSQGAGTEPARPAGRVSPSRDRLQPPPWDSAPPGTALEGLSARPNPTGAPQLGTELGATGTAVALGLPGAEGVGREEMNWGWKLAQLRGTAALCVKSKGIRKGRERDTAFVCAHVRVGSGGQELSGVSTLGQLGLSLQLPLRWLFTPAAARKPSSPPDVHPVRWDLTLTRKLSSSRHLPPRVRAGRGVWVRKPAAGEGKGVPVGSDVSSNNKTPLSALCLGGKRFDAEPSKPSQDAASHLLLAPWSFALSFLGSEASAQLPAQPPLGRTTE